MQEELAERSARLSADTIAKGEQGRNRPCRRPLVALTAALVVIDTLDIT